MKTKILVVATTLLLPTACTSTPSGSMQQPYRTQSNQAVVDRSFGSSSDETLESSPDTTFEENSIQPDSFNDSGREVGYTMSGVFLSAFGNAFGNAVNRYAEDKINRHYERKRIREVTKICRRAHRETDADFNSCVQSLLPH